MNNLAIIPARGGSQRIPKKNIKDFFGKPIIAYTIETAIKSGLFDEVIVSTDSQEIADVSKVYGATVPFLRSDINSNSYATLTDVLIEVIHKYSEKEIEIDSICCILPTAALITQARLLEAYTKFIEKKLGSLVPVIKFSCPIQRALKSSEGLIKMREPEFTKYRTQDLETYYYDSGQFYWVKSQVILNENSIFTQNTGYIELEDVEAQDVDNAIDWEMLEIKYNYLKKIEDGRTI
jgi:pseudaminic acid cytidylyltransferase